MKRRLFSALFRNGYLQKTYLFIVEGDEMPEDDSFDVAELLGITDFEPREHDLIIAPVENFDNDELSLNLLENKTIIGIPKLC
jgi:hypothetical protein